MATPINDIYRRLLEATQGDPDRVPSGWKTVRQWATDFGRGFEQTRKLLRAAVEKGKWEARTFRVQTNRGLYPTPHYREKP